VALAIQALPRPQASSRADLAVPRLLPSSVRAIRAPLAPAALFLARLCLSPPRFAADRRDPAVRRFQISAASCPHMFLSKQQLIGCA